MGASEAAALMIQQCQGESADDRVLPGGQEGDEQGAQGGRPSEMHCPETEEHGTEGDDTALISVPVFYLLAHTVVQGMDVEPTNLQLIKEHLHRQRGEGMTSQEQASSIYGIMQTRGCNDYLLHLPELFEEIGLEVDVNMAVRCLPGPTPFLTWVEAELWDSYVDLYEANIGHESAALQGLRGQSTMPQQERDEWRRWAGFPRPRPTRSRSRSPIRPRPRATQSRRLEREAPVESEQVLEDSGGDVVSLMHRGNREDSREGREARRRRTARGEGRDRSRERGAPNRMGSSRDERVRARVTEETRRLQPRGCSARDEDRVERSSPGAASSRAPPPRHTIRGLGPDMDLIQATGRWLYYFGLRSRGYENFEPANAMTRQTQQELQQELQGLSEWNLGMMNRALLRLMGMLFIEAARTLIQVQELRMREAATETVEVEVEEEDDVSLYVQLHMMTKKRGWNALLEHLMRMAEDGTPGRKELMEALKRRITQSLFLQGDRGAQLQATLVAITEDLQRDEAVCCDTADNDASLVENLWTELKAHLSLDGTPGEARGSEDVIPREPLADPGHHDSQVQQWEKERQEDLLTREAEVVDEETEDRAREEQAQNERDVELFLEHERSAFRDWENWVLLNTPTTQKRRRLTLTVQDESRRHEQGASPVTMWLPPGQGAFELNMRIDQAELPPTTRPDASTTQLPIDSVIYDRTYQAWKNGAITDAGVEQIYGNEWLFLFQLTLRGVEPDTMGPIVLDEEGQGQPTGSGAIGSQGLPSGGPQADGAGAMEVADLVKPSVARTLPDSSGSPGGGGGQWSQLGPSMDGVVLEVGDSSLELHQEDYGRDELPAACAHRDQDEGCAVPAGDDADADDSGVETTEAARHGRV